MEQCKRALLFLGYAQSLVNLDNLTKIIINQRESLKLLQTQSTKASVGEQEKEEEDEKQECNAATPAKPNHELIDFDLFCMISAYLSVLQQEIHESGCISPIKGTNVPPPQVYFTNGESDQLVLSYASYSFYFCDISTQLPMWTFTTRQAKTFRAHRVMPAFHRIAAAA